ncbi:MAG: cyclophane-forming radical SAM/SPASM peptide maturase GrrM/OscB [Steroidobacteraceae bacterium]|jgi:uncharacterized protein
MSPQPSDSPTVNIVVVQPTPFCNINCSYCYLPQRADKTVMQHSTVRNLFEQLFASSWASQELTVIWHAGEPLVVPPAFYESAFRTIAALCPGSVHVRHSIQTNGMLLSTEWCDLFKRWHVGVGVSIDGPKLLNDAHRLTRTGRSTFDQALAGIRLLRRERVPFHVISVLSQKSMEAPRELLDFYVAEGIEDVCFNVEESEGAHVSPLLVEEEAQRRFRDFLGTFWRLARQGDKIHFIREIDGMLPRVFRPEGEGVRNVQVEPFCMLNIDCNGNVSTFSPELLGLKNAKYNDFVIGNINAASLEDMFRGAVMRAMLRDIAAGVELCRQSCEYFSVCGGGAPVNKLFENGSFNSARTSFCDLTQKVPIDLILEAFSRFESRLEEDEVMKLVQGAVHRARGIGVQIGS